MPSAFFICLLDAIRRAKVHVIYLKISCHTQSGAAKGKSIANVLPSSV